MLAVLPFANLSGDPEQEYFSDVFWVQAEVAEAVVKSIRELHFPLDEICSAAISGMVASD